MYALKVYHLKVRMSPIRRVVSINRLQTVIADGYVNDENGVSNSFCLSGKHYFRPATSDEILIGRALTEEQQLLVKELKLKIELAKIEFMKCGLSEDEAIEQVDMVLKAAFKEVFYPKK